MTHDFSYYDQYLGLGQTTPAELRYLRAQTARGVKRREDEVAYMRQCQLRGVQEKQEILDWHRGALSAIEQEMASRGVKVNPRRVNPGQGQPAALRWGPRKKTEDGYDYWCATSDRGTTFCVYRVSFGGNRFLVDAFNPGYYVGVEATLAKAKKLAEHAASR